MSTETCTYDGDIHIKSRGYTSEYVMRRASMKRREERVKKERFMHTGSSTGCFQRVES